MSDPSSRDVRHEEGNLFQRFLDSFAKVPEPRAPIIPQRWRIPFFLALIAVSLLLLALLVWLVVVPGIEAARPAVTACFPTLVACFA